MMKREQVSGLSVVLLDEEKPRVDDLVHARARAERERQRTRDQDEREGAAGVAMDTSWVDTGVLQRGVVALHERDIAPGTWLEPPCRV